MTRYWSQRDPVRIGPSYVAMVGVMSRVRWRPPEPMRFGRARDLIAEELWERLRGGPIR